jgi:hypothetical protein
MVWMVHNTTGIEYQCGYAGVCSRTIADHGMYGAYPAIPDRPSYAHDTKLKQRIDARQPLVHERGDPERGGVERGRGGHREAAGRDAMELSPDYGDELRTFWDLPEDFPF